MSDTIKRILVVLVNGLEKSRCYLRSSMKHGLSGTGGNEQAPAPIVDYSGHA